MVPDDSPRTPPPPPDELASEVAFELVRAFAAVDHWRRETQAAHPDLAPAELAERLEATLAERLRSFAFVFGDDVHNDLLILLPEAIDNLGCGCGLDPEAVPALLPATPGSSRTSS